MSNFSRTIDRWKRERGPLRIMSASGQLGYGVIEPSFRRGLTRDLHLIGADMGSVDPGPYYLGAGRIATAPRSTRRDLALLLEAAAEHRIPVIIGSAGTGGGAAHVETVVEIANEIATDRGYSLKLATIAADMPRDLIKRQLAAGKISNIGAIGDLTEDDIDQSSTIVGQMGVEALIRAIETEPDVIIAGRSCDTAIFASLPILLGFPHGPALQMAKIIECASLCCQGGGRDSMLATLDGDSFILDSMAPQRHATPMSVAAHGLYEEADPLKVIEPDGVLRLDQSTFEAVDEHRCRAAGGVFEPSDTLSVKLEGAARVGARAVYFAGSADPVFIEKADEIAASVEAMVRDLVPPRPEKPYDLYFRFYGLGAVSNRPVSTVPEEVGVLVECIAETAEEAHAVVASAKQYLLHATYPDRISTAGNLAFPFTPPEISAGDAYRFSIYHVMEVDELAPLFPVTVRTIGAS